MPRMKIAAGFAAVAAFVSTMSFAAEARADGLLYKCDSGIATATETKTYPGGKDYFAQEVLVYTVVATGCKPSGGAAAKGVTDKLVRFLAHTGEVVNQSGKTTSEGENLVGSCQHADAGDGSGLVTLKGCTAGIFG